MYPIYPILLEIFQKLDVPQITYKVQRESSAIQATVSLLSITCLYNMFCNCSSPDCYIEVIYLYFTSLYAYYALHKAIV